MFINVAKNTYILKNRCNLVILPTSGVFGTKRTKKYIFDKHSKCSTSNCPNILSVAPSFRGKGQE